MDTQMPPRKTVALPIEQNTGDGFQRLPSAQPAQNEPSYYDLSFLKPPVWKWQIAGYFFFGGISAGAYILSRIAERFGKGKYRELSRAGAYTSFLTSLPCAPLLIHDLGDPKRFHHMLRVFKPASPMSLGTWTLTAYSGAAALAVLREWLGNSSARNHKNLMRKLGDNAVVSITDGAGIPLAVLMAGYTGVLLSCTANPIWSKSPWLGPLFSSAALSTGASAVSLALESANSKEKNSKEILTDITAVSHVAELIALAGYLRERGELARPLIQGKYAKPLLFSLLGIFGSEVLKRLEMKTPAKRWTNLAASCLSLAGGLALRSAIVYAGQGSAQDPRAARKASA
jgi:formate-dependent nitrite reductase membrane component NrfD